MSKAAIAIRRYLSCAVAVCALIFVCFKLIPLNATTVALLILLLVLAAATKWGLPEAIFTSVVSVLGLNYFFLPPILQFTIADPENWVALFVFLATAAIVSELSAQAKRRTEEAVTGRNEIGRLYELSRAMLMDEARDAVRVSVTKTGQILQLRHVAFYDAAANRIYGSLDDSKISQADLVRVAETGERSGDGDYSIVPVRLGAHVVGSLALQGARVSPTVEDSVASAVWPWYNVTLGLEMLIGRFLVLLPALAIAGSLVRKKLAPITRGTVPAHGFLFGGMLVGTIMIVTAPTFFPTLSLAPIAEHYPMKSGVLFP